VAQKDSISSHFGHRVDAPLPEWGVFDDTQAGGSRGAAAPLEFTE